MSTFARRQHSIKRLSPAHSLPVEKGANAPSRVGKEVETHFAALPPHVEGFTHFAQQSGSRRTLMRLCRFQGWMRNGKVRKSCGGLESSDQELRHPCAKQLQVSNNKFQPVAHDNASRVDARRIRPSLHVKAEPKQR